MKTEKIDIDKIKDEDILPLLVKLISRMNKEQFEKTVIEIDRINDLKEFENTNNNT